MQCCILKLTGKQFLKIWQVLVAAYREIKLEPSLKIIPCSVLYSIWRCDVGCWVRKKMLLTFTEPQYHWDTIFPLQNVAMNAIGVIYHLLSRFESTPDEEKYSWHCKPGQEPVDGEIANSRKESNVILLHQQVIKLLSKYFYLCS